MKEIVEDGEKRKIWINYIERNDVSKKKERKNKSLIEESIFYYLINTEYINDGKEILWRKEADRRKNEKKKKKDKRRIEIRNAQNRAKQRLSKWKRTN